MRYQTSTGGKSAAQLRYERTSVYRELRFRQRVTRLLQGAVLASGFVMFVCVLLAAKGG